MARRNMRQSLALTIVSSIALLGVEAVWHADTPSAYAQVPSAPITASGLHTQVSAPFNSPSGAMQYDITGGTRPGGGPNLFHSFGNFNVPNNNIANFLNESPSIPTSNILGRVTGGNISNIFGTIQTTGFGNANLFLMNPAGFLFGPNATVNVGGMAAFTSADYIKLGDGARFNAITDAVADALLTAAPVAAFGFLGSDPGAITVQGSQLTVSQGQGLSLIGGNITVQSGTLNDGTIQAAKLSAPGGQINLVSVASPGEVLYPSLTYSPNINGQSFTTMGNISLSQGATLDVSSDAAGTIKIRGGQLVISDATLSADTGNTSGALSAIDVQITGNMTVADSRGLPAMSARSAGDGDAGQVEIKAGNLAVTSTATSSDPTATIDTHTAGMGRAGNVSIETGDLQVKPESSASNFFIDSGTTGSGHGGDISITGKSIQLENTSINTGDLVARLLFLTPSGSAGNLTITGNSLQLNNVGFDVSAFSSLEAFQQAGDITINAHDIRITNSQFGSTGNARGGAFSIHADTFIADASFFETDTVFGAGGGITVNAHVVELRDGSSLISSTFGDGMAGEIHITASDHVSLLGHTPADPTTPFNFRPSGFFSNSLGFAGTSGGSGSITVTTPNLIMTEGGRINTSTATSGHGGDVTINAANSVSISGEFSTSDVEPIFGVGPVHPSGILTVSVGGACSGPCGNAGRILITTAALNLGSGAQINSGTSTSGQGGNISINTNTGSISGTLTDGSPAGIFSRTVGTDPDSGPGGTISLTAAQSVSLSGGSSIAASSTGPANAGNILINAGQNFTATNASVKTDAAQASGGNITVNASDMVHLTNSQINASVQGAQTTIGGNVTIDPSFVILQNSQILAQATQGQGGNISITTNSLLSDAGSLISASSQSGVNGTVTVQSPISQAGGKIIPLSKTTLETTALLSQRCAALTGGQYSTFVVAGRDALPAEPGSWLGSPLVALSAPASAIPLAPGGVSSDVQESPIVSLRRVPWAGSLTSLLSTDWLAGCRS